MTAVSRKRPEKSRERTSAVSAPRDARSTAAAAPLRARSPWKTPIATAPAGLWAMSPRRTTTSMLDLLRSVDPRFALHDPCARVEASRSPSAAANADEIPRFSKNDTPGECPADRSPNQRLAIDAGGWSENMTQLHGHVVRPRRPVDSTPQLSQKSRKQT